MSTDFSINYASVIQNLKEKIRKARLHAAYTANTQVLVIYWEIGKTISEQEKEDGWGNKIIDTLAIDLRVEFPDMKGFSIRNLRYMRDFSVAYPFFSILQQAAAKLEFSQYEDGVFLEKENKYKENVILQQLAAKLPWGHHTTLLDKVKDGSERLFYIEQTTLITLFTMFSKCCDKLVN
jgi:predicted nuclease of restriction endonuclease-like (RecB) superfamily